MMRLMEATSILRLNIRSIYGFLGRYRGFSSVPGHEFTDDLHNQVLVEGRAWSRTAILNRPTAINTSMAARLQQLYIKWENDPDVGFVVLKGNGRAFCAGGDIVALYHLVKKGKIEDCKRLCREVYTFIYIIGTYLKPHVALLNGITMGSGAGVSIPGTFRVVLLNGITMGSGAGVSIPGTFRVATEKTVFATPETLIGFHTDAGASFYLSRLPGHLGDYLALTGAKLNGAEMIACGLATHYSTSSRIPLIEQHLRAIVTDDPSTVEATLEKYCVPVVQPESSVHSRFEAVDTCFSCDTVEEIIDAAENEAARTKDEWWDFTARRLKEVAPLSLKVSLRSIREGRFQTLDQCLEREYHMSLQGMSKRISGDFVEGIRTRLVEDSAPKWEPPTVEQVSTDMVDHYFTPISPFEPGLDLPTELRETFTYPLVNVGK